MEEKKRKVCENRISVSFPSDVYSAICAFADKNRVSVAWVVREAAVRYLQEGCSVGHPK